jgi:hypothetical protein
LKVAEIQLSCPQVFALSRQVSQTWTEDAASQFEQCLTKTNRKVRREDEQGKEKWNLASPEYFYGAAPTAHQLSVTREVNTDNQDKTGNP